MIICEGLFKQFDELAAVSDFNLELARGQIVGLTGPNAAGKTTTLRMVSGFARPSAGRVLIEGKQLHALANPSSVLGMVLDGAGAPGNVSVREFLRQVSLSAGTGRRFLRKTVEALGLEPVERIRFKACSLGSKRRVMLAAALLARPRYLLLDEPLNGLDPNTVQWLTSFLRGLCQEQGTGILLSSHLLDEQARTCDKLVVMGSGRVLAAGSTEQIVGAFRRPSVKLSTLPKHQERLQAHLVRHGWQATRTEEYFEVSSASPEHLGEELFAAGFPLTCLELQIPTLQEAYFSLTADHLALRSTVGAKHGVEHATRVRKVHV